jgi:endo-1,4-beta-mannosidase
MEKEEGAMAKIGLGIRETQFNLNGKSTFLLGISYYGALGASEEFIRCDLDDMKHYGFNWIRVWATWGAFGNEVSAVDSEGNPREPFLGKLKWLVDECDEQGMVVDITLSRGNGVTGPGRLQTLEAHRRAVETLITTLKPFRSWYLDLGNERNVQDRRFVSFQELGQLSEVAKQFDPQRLITASDAGDISRNELREYLLTAHVDFISTHRPRNASSPQQTGARSREYLAWMREIGRVVPLHYQEPLRRGWFTDGWEPPVSALITDLKQAIAGGAAGWCFHNGDQRNDPEGKPRRSFDLRERRLFDQLDEEEHRFLDEIQKIFMQ